MGGSELVHDPKNGVLVDNSKEHKSKLQLDAVSRKHEGLLTCEAANYHGSNKMSLQLTVHGKPSMPEVTFIRDQTVVSHFSPVLDISSRILVGFNQNPFHLTTESTDQKSVNMHRINNQ